MARPLRITYPGAFYHVTSRGNERKNVFKTKKDREQFLEYLESAVVRYDAVIHVFCLMDNHYHLLLETPSANLPQIMRHINGAYTTYFNNKHRRAGHLFQGRFKAILVDKDAYAKELSRYIHLNPVRAKVIDLPENYRWSSHQYYAGLKKRPGWLSMDFILGYFGDNRKNAGLLYHQFVTSIRKEEYASPLEHVVASSILGDSSFVEKIKKEYVSVQMENKDVPALKQLMQKPGLEEICDAVDAVFGGYPEPARNVKMYLARTYSGKSLKEIGDQFHIGESGVAQAAKRVFQKIQIDQKLEKLIGQVESLLNK